MKISLVLVLLIFGLTSCAYNISSDKKQLPGGYDHVFLPPFSNRTKLPGIEVYFTNSLGREIRRAAVAKISDKNNSQVTIEGVIQDLRFAPSAPSESIKQLPKYATLFTSYRIFVETAVTVRRNSDNQVIWNGVIRGEKSYDSPQVASAGINTVDPLYNHSARHQYIGQLAQDMMIEAIDRMTEQF
ncbi:MAG: hypothetical protein A4S09_12045 [Proteobacteria bacterium SG_bin7]|nr:MAG: hypothetical protein A4S09_12045 [Proteobacteria bacterium SG_bin7]